VTELGKKLKEAREAKGLSLDDLQSLTKIQKRYLLGIEEGNYSMIPGKFYVRAFIKQYAEAVGLSPEEIFEQYKQEIPSTHDEQLNENLSRVQSKKHLSDGTSKLLDLLPKLLIGAIIIGALALVYVFAQKSADDPENKQAVNDNQEVKIEESENLKNNTESKNPGEKQKENTKQNSDKDNNIEAQDTKQAEKNKKESESAVPEQSLSVVAAQGKKTTYELKNTNKFELKVQTTGQTWVNILNGKGTSFYQGMLQVGGTESQTFDFSKETEAVIVVGRSLDTQIFVNGQKLEYAVPPTEQVRQDITIRYVPASQ
jgi:cytoskeletal protein RodZ